MKSFYYYVIDKYLGKNNQFGDFAYDLLRDRNITERMKQNDDELFRYLDKAIVDYQVEKTYNNIKRKSNFGNIIYYILVVAIVILGALINSIIPINFKYILGYWVGTIITILVFKATFDKYF